MTWLTNTLKWIKILWNLRSELEAIATLIQKHKVYLENDFEALRKIKEQLQAINDEQSTL